MSCSGLTKRYGDKTAVDHLTFTVRPGGVTGFLGPNGAGKSTTMRMLLGLDHPTSGAYRIDGHPYAAADRAVAAQVGALLDAKAIHGGRTAHNHLLCWPSPTASRPTGSTRCSETVGPQRGRARSAPRASRWAWGSGWASPAALLGDPEVLLFDEPVNGLDPEGIHWIRNLMSGLAGRAVRSSSPAT